MLTLDSMDASTPCLSISRSFICGLKSLAQAKDTTEDIALELLRPYPDGISDLREILSFDFSRLVFGTAFSITLFIKRELILDSLFSKTIPVPCIASMVDSTLSEIPSVAPFPVAIAFTIETAPCMTAFANVIQNLPK